ncbi:uncharacterized protein LOC134250868 [Saccostrea cucullata]|uniref:uncharacterized protein LOC134250868 n=1 Tax=Saccostrea cuccullata TaxID=36930 RepID=UPI002ED00026
MTGLKYRKDILHPIVRRIACTLGEDFILMDDNARPHRARIQHISVRLTLPQNRRELQTALPVEWQQIPQASLGRLMSSMVVSQHTDIQKTIVGCISDNVTLSFDLPEKKDRTVDSYIWYKQDVLGDPSFARYTVAENKFEIFRDAQNRLIHNHNNASQPRNLVLLNVQKSDISKYVLVINYVNVTQDTSEYLLQLSVKDVCFAKPMEEDGCVTSTCFTGENGTLTKNKETGQTVNGYHMIRDCTKGVTVGYKCCNAAGDCEEQMFKVPAKDENKDDGSPVVIIVAVTVGLGVLLVIFGALAVLMFYKRCKDEREEMLKGKEDI